MGRLGVKTTESKDKNDKRLKEHFINGISDQTMSPEILKELKIM